MRARLAERCRAQNALLTLDHPMADLTLSDTLPQLLEQATEFALNKDKAAIGDDIHGLRMLCLYGLKRRRGLYGTRTGAWAAGRKRLRGIPPNYGLI